jgi:hypothetical protein
MTYPPNSPELNIFSVDNASRFSIPFTVEFRTRDPLPTDVNYYPQKIWLNTVNNVFWFLKNFIPSSNGIILANWIPLGGSIFATLYTENTGTATPSLGNLNVLGTNGIITQGSGNTVTISGVGIAYNYTNVNHASSPYTVLTTDYFISVDCSAGTVQLNFPNSPTFKQIWIVKDRTGNAATNNITLTTPGGTVTIDGLTTYTMNSNYQAINLLANASPTYEVY